MNLCSTIYTEMYSNGLKFYTLGLKTIIIRVKFAYEKNYTD